MFEDSINFAKKLTWIFLGLILSSIIFAGLASFFKSKTLVLIIVLILLLSALISLRHFKDKKNIQLILLGMITAIAFGLFAFISPFIPEWATELGV